MNLRAAFEVELTIDMEHGSAVCPICVDSETTGVDTVSSLVLYEVAAHLIAAFKLPVGSAITIHIEQ